MYRTFIIIIIIMSRYQHGYLWPSLTTPPYRLLLLAGFPGYIHYLHRAAVCMFDLDVLPLLVAVKGSTYELVPTSPAVSRMSGSSNVYKEAKNISTKHKYYDLYKNIFNHKLYISNQILERSYRYCCMDALPGR